MSGGVEYLTDEELSTELSTVFTREQMLAARRLELIREADGRDLARRQGATSLVAWLAETLLVSGPAAKQMVKLAAVLHTPAAEATGRALAAGVINEEQASVIGGQVTGLACTVDAMTVAKAEQWLIGAASEFGPHELTVLAARVLEHVAPQLAEARLAKQLADAERRAHRDRMFTLTPDGTGRVRLSGWLAAEAAAVVNAALDPLCAPGRIASTSLFSNTSPPDGPGQAGDGPAGSRTPGAHSEADDTGNGSAGNRTPGQRRADALVEVCRLALNTTELPENGGDRPQVVVTINFADLAQQVGAGMLDTGQSVTAQTVRQMACDALLIPAVLGSAGQVLDLGRERRLFTGPLRRALVLRDGGCAFPGCHRPPRWCAGHHIQHWADGGPTCLANSRP